MSPAEAIAILEDWARGVPRALPAELAQPNDSSTDSSPCQLSAEQRASIRRLLDHPNAEEETPPPLNPLWLAPP